MHVDVVRIGEHELHVTQHIFGSRRLLEAVVVDVDIRPIHRVGIDLPAARVDAQVVGVEHGLGRVPATEDAEEARARALT